MASIQERDQYWELEVGVDAQGRLKGVRGAMISDAGAFTYQGINMPYNASTSFPGPYMLPHYRLHVAVVETNKVGTAPVRGAGYPEGAFAMERVLDAVADALGLDRVEVRRRNLVPAEAMPYTTPMAARSQSRIVYESGDFPACLDRALQGRRPCRLPRAPGKGVDRKVAISASALVSASKAPVAARSSPRSCASAGPARRPSIPARWRWARACRRSWHRSPRTKSA